MEKKGKENHGTKVTKIPKTKRRKYGTNETLVILLQYALDLRKPDLRKNLNLRKNVATTDFLVHKLFDITKIF